MSRKKDVTDGVTCKLCDKLLANRKGLSYHVKVVHNTQFIDYVLQFEHDGVKPTCACGCGGELSFFGGRFMLWVNGHVPSRRQTLETRNRISNSQKGKICSIESNERRSETMKRVHKERPELAQKASKANKERVVSDETRALQSVVRTAKIASGEIVINRDAISKTVTDLYMNDGIAWATGTHFSSKMNKSFHYKASYEPQYMKLLDEDEDVISWEYEFTVILYELDGKKRRYVPDFHVTRTGNRHEFIEVKPVNLRTRPMNVAKRLTAIEFCKSRGWAYKEWSPE